MLLHSILYCNTPLYPFKGQAVEFFLFFFSFYYMVIFFRTFKKGEKKKIKKISTGKYAPLKGYSGVWCSRYRKRKRKLKQLLKGADKLPMLERKIEYGGKNPVSLCSIANGQAVVKEGLSTKRKEKTKDENF